MNIIRTQKELNVFNKKHNLQLSVEHIPCMFNFETNNGSRELVIYSIPQVLNFIHLQEEEPPTSNLLFQESLMHSKLREPICRCIVSVGPYEYGYASYNKPPVPLTKDQMIEMALVQYWESHEVGYITECLPLQDQNRVFNGQHWLEYDLTRLSGVFVKETESIDGGELSIKLEFDNKPSSVESDIEPKASGTKTPSEMLKYLPELFPIISQWSQVIDRMRELAKKESQ